MSKVFKKTNFNITKLLDYLQENGFDIYNKGGTYNPNFTNKQ